MTKTAFGDIIFLKNNLCKEKALDNNKNAFSVIEAYLDIILNFIAILCTYPFVVLIYRFDEIPLDITNLGVVSYIVIIAVLSSFVYNALNIYKPLISFKKYRNVSEIVRAGIILWGMLELFIIGVAEPTRTFLFFWILFAGIVSVAFMITKRLIVISALRLLQKKQFVLRKIIIVGDNTASAAEFVKEIQKDAQYNFMVLGYIGDKINEEAGCQRLGPLRNFASILDTYKPTDVVFAIESYERKKIIKLVNICDDRCVRVYFLPVIFGFFKSPRQIEQLGALPLINVHSTPLDGRMNSFIKRTMDIIVSLLTVIVTSPALLIAAIGVKLSSPGPILARERRIGKLGKEFNMYKFRTRYAYDKDGNELVGTGEYTGFGKIIHTLFIDELPKFFNVLKGEMSLVGPRAEISEYVGYFKERVPLYMIKHYVKPGITGLAQVRGLSERTSLEQSVHNDIEYIENWSFSLDWKILLITPFSSLKNHKNHVSPEMYSEPENATRDDLNTTVDSNGAQADGEEK